MGIYQGGIYDPVSDTAYDATAWDGVTSIAPSKGAVRDKLVGLVAQAGDIDQVATDFSVNTYTTSGSAQTIDSTPRSLQVASTAGFPATGTLLIGTGVAEGSVPTRVIATYASIVDGTHFGGVTASGSSSVPDLTQVVYAVSGLNPGAIKIANQIITGAGVDGRPHDLVLVAAFDPSPGHTYGDYDVIITREAGSYGVLGIALPLRFQKDCPFTDGQGNKLLTFAGGVTNTNGGPSTITPQTIQIGASLVGQQGANKNLVLTNGGTSAEILMKSSNGTTMFKVTELGPTIPNNVPITFLSAAGSAGNITFTSGNTFSIRAGSNGFQVVNNAYTFTNIKSSDAGDVSIGRTAPTTTATTGFPYVPAMAGTPTGVPTGVEGFVPVVYDTTGKKLWVYDAGWKGVVVA